MGISQRKASKCGSITQDWLVHAAVSFDLLTRCLGPASGSRGRVAERRQSSGKKPPGILWRDFLLRWEYSGVVLKRLGMRLELTGRCPGRRERRQHRLAKRGQNAPSSPDRMRSPRGWGWGQSTAHNGQVILVDRILSRNR